MNGQLDASVSEKTPDCCMLVGKQGGSRARLGANKIAVFSSFYFTRKEYLILT